MSPVTGLLALIAEMEELYARHKPAYQAAAIAESTRLRAWSLGIQCRQDFDDSADAIFAKGMNIIGLVHLRALREKFCAIFAALGETQRRTIDIDALLARMQQIELDLETKSNGVLDYPGLKALNYSTSVELAHLHTDLGYTANRLVGVREVALQFRKLHAELREVQQRLAVDDGDIFRNPVHRLHLLHLPHRHPHPTSGWGPPCYPPPQCSPIPHRYQMTPHYLPPPIHPSLPR